MLFMVTSRPKPGVSRKELIDHLTQRMHPSTWNLVRNGTVSNVFYKIGDEPGFFAVLSAASADEARALVDPGTGRLEVFDLDLVPINQFPHFD